MTNFEKKLKSTPKLQSVNIHLTPVIGAYLFEYLHSGLLDDCKRKIFRSALEIEACCYVRTSLMRGGHDMTLLTMPELTSHAVSPRLDSDSPLLRLTLARCTRRTECTEIHVRRHRKAGEREGREASLHLADANLDGICR